MQRQEQEQAPAQEITAKQLAILLEEKRRLKASLQQAYEAKQATRQRLSNLEEESRKSNSASLHFQATAEQTKQSLEQAHEEIGSLKGENQDLTSQLQEQKAQATASEQMVAQIRLKLSKAENDIETLQLENDVLSGKNEELEEQLKKAKQEAAKTPRWKIILGLGLFITGVLLTMTGVGGAAGIPMTGLGYAAFGVGSATLVGGFLYGVYKGIRACCFPSSKETADKDIDSSVSTVDLDESVHGNDNHQRRAAEPESPVMSRANHLHGATSESKHEERGRERSTYGQATNRYGLLNGSAAAALRGTASQGVEAANVRKRGRRQSSHLAS